MTEEKKITVEFAPGAFDQFDGTQEELDELIMEITRMAESGELAERSRKIDLDNLSESDMEIVEHLIKADDSAERQLQ
jgi:hypothetical protein